MVQVDQPSTLDVPQQQVGKRILRATGALMLIQVIIKGFGLIEKMILGYCFGGTSYLTDAYNAAKDIAFYLFQLVDQAVMHSFLPVFVQRMRERGEQDAWKLASTTINLLMGIMAVIAVLGVVYTPQLMPLFLPDWFKPGADVDPALADLTIKMTRAMLVAVIFLATSSLTYCLLNSYKQFALPASADLALKGTVLVFAILFAKSWGPYALAVGFVIGAVAKVAVHSTGLGRRLGHYRPTVELRDPDLKRFGLLALPLLAGVSISIVRQVFDQRFISSLPEGSYAALKFARQLCDMPVSNLAFVFGIALFPFLADIAAKHDYERLRGMLMTASRMMVLIFLPLAVCIILLRVPIVTLLFSENSMLTTRPLTIYALGMLIGALEIIVLQFYFAMADTLRPTIIGALMVPLHVAVAYLGVYKWEWGVVAIAAALLISKGTKIIVLYAIIRRRLHNLEGLRTLALFGKVLLALLPLLGVLLLANHFLPMPHGLDGAKAKLLAISPLMVAGGVGMFLYGIVLHLLRTEETSLLVDKVRGKLAKRATSTPA